MNLARNLIDDRKAFAFALFVDHPDLTVAEAYKAVKKKFRLGMDRGRLSRLKKAATKATHRPTPLLKTNGTPVILRRPSSARAKPRAENEFVWFEAPRSGLGFGTLEDQVRQIVREEIQTKLQSLFNFLEAKLLWDAKRG